MLEDANVAKPTMATLEGEKVSTEAIADFQTDTNPSVAHSSLFKEDNKSLEAIDDNFCITSIINLANASPTKMPSIAIEPDDMVHFISSKMLYKDTNVKIYPGVQNSFVLWACSLVDWGGVVMDDVCLEIPHGEQIGYVMDEWGDNGVSLDYKFKYQASNDFKDTKLLTSKSLGISCDILLYFGFWIMLRTLLLWGEHFFATYKDKKSKGYKKGEEVTSSSHQMVGSDTPEVMYYSY